MLYRHQLSRQRPAHVAGVALAEVKTSTLLPHSYGTWNGVFFLLRQSELNDREPMIFEVKQKFSISWQSPHTSSDLSLGFLEGVVFVVKLIRVLL